MRYWQRFKPGGGAYTVEAYWHNDDVIGAYEITKAEFDAFMASLPEPPPGLNLEIESIKIRLRSLEDKLGITA